MRRGWFPPKVDPSKVGAVVATAPPAVAAVVFAIQSKDAAAWGTATTAVLTLAVMLGLVRPNVTPSSSPLDVDGTPLKRPDGSEPKGTEKGQLKERVRKSAKRTEA